MPANQSACATKTANKIAGKESDAEINGSNID
jgi:hypothetical protein